MRHSSTTLQYLHKWLYLRRRRVFCWRHLKLLNLCVDLKTKRIKYRLGLIFQYYFSLNNSLIANNIITDFMHTPGRCCGRRRSCQSWRVVTQAPPQWGRNLGLESLCGSSSACHLHFYSNSDKYDLLRSRRSHRRIPLIASTAGTETQHNVRVTQTLWLWFEC